MNELLGGRAVAGWLARVEYASGPNPPRPPSAVEHLRHEGNGLGSATRVVIPADMYMMDCAALNGIPEQRRGGCVSIAFPLRFARSTVLQHGIYKR